MVNNTETEMFKNALFRIAHAVYTKSNYHVNDNLLSELYFEIKDELNLIGAYDDFVDFSNNDSPTCLGLKKNEDKEMTREQFLKEAEKIVCTDREGQYGAPEDNFGIIAEFWDSYLKSVLNLHEYGTLVDGVDVAVMMALFKIARIATGQPKTDNWIDLIGYAACGGEIQFKED